MHADKDQQEEKEKWPIAWKATKLK